MMKDAKLASIKLETLMKMELKMMKLISHSLSACVVKNEVTWLKTVHKNQTSEPATTRIQRVQESEKSKTCEEYLLTLT